MKTNSPGSKLVGTFCSLLAKCLIRFKAIFETIHKDVYMHIETLGLERGTKSKKQFWVGVDALRDIITLFLPSLSLIKSEKGDTTQRKAQGNYPS